MLHQFQKYFQFPVWDTEIMEYDATDTIGTFKVTIVGAIIGSIILPIKLFFVQNLD